MSLPTALSISQSPASDAFTSQMNPKWRTGVGTVEPAAWIDGARLGLSFIPNGTQVLEHESDLFESFSSVIKANEIRNSIIRAFQSWAVHANLNVGLREDSGDRLGSSSATYQSQKFGDIRIAAIPMSAEVFAISSKHEVLSSGSLSGAIIFNSSAKFDDADHFYRVALHEAGHVLGLEHSRNVNSVMHRSAIVDDLSSEDIDGIVGLYGNRSLDREDSDGKSNDSMKNATRLKNPGSLKGRVPLVAFGDIGTESDRDFFRLSTREGDGNSLTVRAVSRGISSLKYRLTVFDEDGRRIAHRGSHSVRGGDIQIKLDSYDAGRDYFIRLSSATTGIHSKGSYALIATFDDTVQIDPARTTEVARGNYYFLKQTDVHRLLLNKRRSFHADDEKLNDTPLEAIDLETRSGYREATHYAVSGGLLQSTDVDVFRVRAPKETLKTNVLTIQLDALQEQGLLARVSILDENFTEMKSKTLVSGNGKLVLQATGIKANDQYFVSIRAEDAASKHATGDYRLVASFDQDEVSLFSLGSKKLTSQKTAKNHALHVAESQVFHFALDTLRSATREKLAIWMTIYGPNQEVVYRLAAKPGTFRSAQSVLLTPGSYRVRVSAAAKNEAQFESVSYTIRGIGITDQTGPTLVDPSKRPIRKCRPGADEYCYPGNIETSDVFVMVPGTGSTPPPKQDDPIFVDPDAWYWYRDWLTSNIPEDL